MKLNLKRLFSLLLSLIAILSMLSVSAENVGATDLTKQLEITLSSGGNKQKITDGKINTYTAFKGGDTVTLSSGTPIGSVYIMWNKLPGEWRLSLKDKDILGGRNGFLHECISLEAPESKVTLNIPQGGAQITDIYAFSAGEVPNWVQKWDVPCSLADLLLFSTHSDDEQLFFAGLLPYYAIERKAAVQVVYMTNHNDSVQRPHELLNGLWTVGIRNYPVISAFPDDARSLGKTSETRATVLKRAQDVYKEDDWIKFQVTQLRRFKPQVVVGHDFDGEYRHGAHILNSDALTSALKFASDKAYDPETVKSYGVWDVPKAYFHLYGENPITMNYDTPYASMGGKTPFQVTKQGYACHLSQQWTWFTDWISKGKAADIATYNPCKFGLYKTTVGSDVLKNDMLENITLYPKKKTESGKLTYATPVQKTESTQASVSSTAQKPESKVESETSSIVVSDVPSEPSEVESSVSAPESTPENPAAGNSKTKSNKKLLAASLIITLLVGLAIIFIPKWRKKK